MIEHAENRAVVSDEEIIEMYWQRQESAIQATDTKYGQFLFRIAYNILHDKPDCEECRNDTYFGIWNAIPPTKPAVFPAFITRIMRCIAINRYKEKSEKRRIPSELTVAMENVREILHSDNSVEKECEIAELGRAINDYVRGLPERQRYIFIDRFYLAEPTERIASDLSISVPTVYREIKRIACGLREYLERRGINT